jgi:hypothetical protein
VFYQWKSSLAAVVYSKPNALAQSLVVVLVMVQGPQSEFLGVSLSQLLLQHCLQLLSHLRTDMGIRNSFLPGKLDICQLLLEHGNLGSHWLLDVRVHLEGIKLLKNLYQR